MDLLIVIILVVIFIELTYLVLANTNLLSHTKETRPVFVDTSVLIDGRILAIASSGFITSTLNVPRSVIAELQYMADNADAEKRTRARYGLDMVAELQALTNVKVEIFQDSNKVPEGVDDRLLWLAKKFKGCICTIDYNLNKVALVENIPVLNVNDLAMSLRMSYLPGEKMLLELTTKGQEASQAVGHLTDGTMVVVEQASSQIGKIVEIEFIRCLQTSAGKMMFAKLAKPLVRNTHNNRNHYSKPNRQLAQNQGPRRQTSRNSTEKRQYQNRNKAAKNEQDFIDLVNKF